ncbi:MAG: YeiH family protein [Synechococcus sp.]
MHKIDRWLYGVYLCVAIAVISKLLSFYLPLGSVAIALILGIVVGNSVAIGEGLKPGIMFSEKVLLSLAIALMGVNLDYFVLRELGGRTIFLIILAIGLSTSFTVYIARIMGVKPTQALLIGIGNGICGSSAIAATNHIIKAKEEDVGIAIAIVNFLGTIGMLSLPILAKIILGFTDIQVGILIGNTLQAVGQAAAGGFSVSDTAGQTAIIVKMGRVMMLSPFLLILFVSLSSKGLPELRGEADMRKQQIPLFIFGFIFFSLLSTFNIISQTYIEFLSVVGNILLLVAMSGIALKINIFSILKNGRKVLMLGCFTFIVQILFSTSLIQLMY